MTVNRNRSTKRAAVPGSLSAPAADPARRAARRGRCAARGLRRHRQGADPRRERRAAAERLRNGRPGRTERRRELRRHRSRDRQDGAGFRGAANNGRSRSAQHAQQGHHHPASPRARAWHAAAPDERPPRRAGPTPTTTTTSTQTTSTPTPTQTTTTTSTPPPTTPTSTTPGGGTPAPGSESSPGASSGPGGGTGIGGGESSRLWWVRYPWALALRPRNAANERRLRSGPYGRPRGTGGRRMW